MIRSVAEKYRNQGMESASEREGDLGSMAAVDFERGKIININKPEGWTSFDVVKKIRSHVGVKKVGHAGTLDPFASGVLLVCTGKATKSIEGLMQLDKEYVGCVELGKTTDTYDRTGAVLSRCEPKPLTLDEVTAACKLFEGEISQIPPMYSAVKVNGQRLYRLARQGKTVDREPRRVMVHRIEVMDYHHPFIELKVVCSKGTYIRSIAFDLGDRLGCGAYLESLVRTRIGTYRIENAYSVADFVQQYSNYVATV